MGGLVAVLLSDETIKTAARALYHKTHHVAIAHRTAHTEYPGNSQAPLLGVKLLLSRSATFRSLAVMELVYVQLALALATHEGVIVCVSKTIFVASLES